MKLKKVSCFNVSRFRVLAEDFFALTVLPEAGAGTPGCPGSRLRLNG